MLHNLCFIFHKAPCISKCIFFCSNNIHNHVLKFKYQLSYLQVKSKYELTLLCGSNISFMLYVMVMMQMWLVEIGYLILSARDVLIVLP
jgi:hypothetical protein